MVTIHSTAVVETDDIGDGTYIGPYTYITKNVSIGRNCKITAASIGMPGEHPNEHPSGDGKVIIGDNVEIREYVTVSASIYNDATIIGDGCYLMAKSHVGHDAILKKRVVLHTGAIIGGHSIIGDYCYLGLNCSTHPRAELGNYCIVGANSMYKSTSPDAIVWVGTPARPIKVNRVGLDRHYRGDDLNKITDEALKYILDRTTW